MSYLHFCKPSKWSLIPQESIPNIIGIAFHLHGRQKNKKKFSKIEILEKKDKKEKKKCYDFY